MAPTRITILHLDDDCVAALKPCGVASVPERAHDETCLRALLEEQLGRRVYPVHRLDKEVSGVILYALTTSAHRFLNTAFEQRHVRKIYLAAVHGTLSSDRGRIDGPLHEFGSGRMGVDEAKGKPSETRYETLQRNDRFSLVRLHPLTGRRHQLRVHLYSIGHPIAGDPRYGDPALRNGHPRLMLTATDLNLTLPSGFCLDLCGVIPDDFRETARQFYALSVAPAPPAAESTASVCAPPL